MTGFPHLGVGVSYRTPWRDALTSDGQLLGCLEVMADDYLDRQPDREAELATLAARFPLLPHAIATSLGTDAPPDETRLRKLAALVERVNAPWASEHVAFTHAEGWNLGHLAPLPYNRESVALLMRNIARWRSVVGVPLLIENIATMISLPGEFTEAQFLTEVLERADCGLLLDLHNVHTNALNHRFDPFEFLATIPLERVVQIHLGGGHDETDGYRIDSHSAATPEPVWELLRSVTARTAVHAVIVEWDLNLPPFEIMLGEVARAEAILRPAARAEASDGAAPVAVGAGAPLH